MIYIAGPFFELAQVRAITDIENELKKHNITFFSPMRSGIIQDMSPKDKRAIIKRVYIDNLIYMKQSEIFVCVIDWLDAGT